MIAALKSSFANAWSQGQMLVPTRGDKTAAEPEHDDMSEMRAEMQALFQDDLDQMTRRARRKAKALPEHS